MSENIPVISIPVDNSGLEQAVSLFEKLIQYADKYKKYGDPGQGLPPRPPAGGTSPSAGSAGGGGDGGGAGAGSGDGGGAGGGGFLNRLNRFAKGIDKAFGEAGKTLGKVTGQLKKLFELSLGWAVKFAMLATGSAFGYDVMAKRTTRQLMGAQGNRMTVGQDNAARNIYGNRFSGYQGTIEALSKAQQNGTSPEARALKQLGIDPRRGAGENLPLVYERMAPILRNNKDSGMGFAHIRAQGLDSLIGGEADANQIIANAADIPGWSRDYREQSQKLDLPDSVSRSSQQLTTTFSNNLDRIANAFKTTLDDPNARGVLDLISKSEGTFSKPGGGYNTMFGGSQFMGFNHPRVRHPFKQTDGTWNVTTAAGRYQFLGKTWDDSAEKLGLTDFSPRNQDIAALHRIMERGHPH